MAPLPLEGNQTPLGAGIPPEGSKCASIPLPALIEFIIQRTYHELTVLAELLPRKSDTERKIEIYNFSNRTRQLFIRLLALVKWANSAVKVDKSAQIMGFLDKQSLLFTDTADQLSRIARDTVVRARVPNFHIPAAVEVLTTGTYSKIPSCVKERIIPSEPITPAEKRATLLRLNQVIQHRLVSSNLMPQMTNLIIENGTVTFHVENEFEVCLTVMGDSMQIPWRLLSIDILVQDRETGGGKSLVHPLQTQYVHQVLQARLASNTQDSLQQVYHFLHYFCLSLQLEVFYAQTRKLCWDRLEGHVQIDEYATGKCLSVSYWRELTMRDARCELGYTLTLFIDSTKPDKPLTVAHVPSLGFAHEAEIADEVTKTDILSMERLLVHTIYIRAKTRLADLKKYLSNTLESVEYTLGGSPAILSLSILNPSQDSEHILVTIDTHSGMIKCHIPQHGPTSAHMSDLQAAFNTNYQNIPSIIELLRYWLTKQRCEKSVQHLAACIVDRIPLTPESDRAIQHLGKNKIFVAFHKYPEIFLIIGMSLNEECKVDFRYYLAHVKRCSPEDEPVNNESQPPDSEMSKLFLKFVSLNELDSFVVTHGPFTSIDAVSDTDIMFGSKSKMDFTVEVEPVTEVVTETKKTVAFAPFFIPELAHVVAFVDVRTPLNFLSQEFTRRGIAHQGVQVEARATALVLKLLQLPPPNGVSLTDHGWCKLNKRVLEISIRSSSKGNGQFCIVELVMHGTPIPNAMLLTREQSMRRPVYFQYELSSLEGIRKLVDSIIADWWQIVHLFSIVEELMEYLRLSHYDLGNLVTVRSYNYTKLVLGYGTERNAIANIQWNSNINAFTILFGSLGISKNGHHTMHQHLEYFLNRTRNLAQLIYILHETYQPLLSANKLPVTPQLCVYSMRPQLPVLTFVLVVQSKTMIRIIYQGMYCLELGLCADGLVTLRDGALSRFASAVVSEYICITGLKTFLSKYEDEASVLRRRSQSEDDNPPSPIRSDSIGSPGGFLSGGTHKGPQSPAQREGGLRFHTPLTPPSNPHTPASPHPGNISQGSTHQPFGSSPATTFNISSPPSLPSNVPHSPSMMPHASPGSALIANSPANPMHVPSPAGLMPNSSPGPASVPVGLSPAGTFLSQPSHMEGSPFQSTQMASPAAGNWPNSPGLQRPSPARPGQSPGGHSALHSPEHKTAIAQTSKLLPQKTWAGSIPTVLSHEALDILCTPSPHPQGIPGPELCPLERFLGCVSLKKQLQRFVQFDPENTYLPFKTAEGGVYTFKVKGLQCSVHPNPRHLQSLHIKLTALPDTKEQWNLDELQILEKYFETKTACPPYRPQSIACFLRMISCPHEILKDFIQILKLDLVPSLAQQQQMKWSIEWCLRCPPSATLNVVPTGQNAFIIHRTRILFFLNFTRIGMTYVGGEAPSLLLPFVYDVTTNITQLAERPQANSPPYSAAFLHIKRFTEFNMNATCCSIFPTIKDFLMNFVLPSEPPQVASQGPPMLAPTGSPMVQSPMMQQQNASIGSPMMQGPTTSYPVTPPHIMPPSH